LLEHPSKTTLRIEAEANVRECTNERYRNAGRGGEWMPPAESARAEEVAPERPPPLRATPKLTGDPRFSRVWSWREKAFPHGCSVSDEKPLLDPDASTPDLEALDSAWDDDDLDEDATMVAQIPKNLVALSRMKDPEKAPPRDEAEPEKHEAITARPPPIAGAPAEPSVVVDAPHQQIADAAQQEATEEAAAPEDDDAEISDAAEGDEEARARAADEAAGLDAEERRKAAEQRTAVRRDKARAKTIAARDRRKAKADVQRQKQKQKKKRSIPPRANERPAPAEPQPTSRERPTVPPARDSASPMEEPVVLPKQSWARMGIIVAVVVTIGALVIGLARC